MAKPGKKLSSTSEIKRLETKLTSEVVWLYVLSLLKKSPSHAYVLRKKIKEGFGFLPGKVTAYVVLYKLEKRGYVESRREEDKKVYSITASGVKLFDEARKLIDAKQKLIFKK